MGFSASKYNNNKNNIGDDEDQRGGLERHREAEEKDLPMVEGKSALSQAEEFR